MLEILEMSAAEIRDALRDLRFGHLGCSRDDQPYVVPIYFAYDSDEIFIYTNAGYKSELIDANPLVCLQAEDILPNGQWRSVIANGRAERIEVPTERERAIELIRESNPRLLPATALRWRNDWIRKPVEIVYRIRITSMSGLCSSEVGIMTAGVRPTFST